MAGKQVQRRRGTSVQHSTFIGAAGEVTVDTNKHTQVVHDGATPGGHPMATEAALALTQADADAAQAAADAAQADADAAQATADAANAAVAGKANINGGNNWTGSQNWSGVGGSVRMYGDFTAATRATRTLFQSSYGGNSETSVGAIPSAGGGRASFTSYSSPNPDDTYAVEMYAANSGLTGINAYGLGSALSLFPPLLFQQKGRTGMQLSADGTFLLTSDVGGSQYGTMRFYSADGSTYGRTLTVLASNSLNLTNHANTIYTHQFADNGNLTIAGAMDSTTLVVHQNASIIGTLNVTAVAVTNTLSAGGDIYTTGQVRCTTGTASEAQFARLRDGAQATARILEAETGVGLNVSYLIASGLRTVAPNTDGACGSGWALARWSTVFAVTGAINTSDQREKTELRAFNDAELAVAKSLAADIGMYQWLSAVESKADDARLHSGMIAQQVQARFTEQGLDAHRYGLFCYDEWEDMPEILDADGEVTYEHHEAGNRYGLRYDELNQFILRGMAENQRLLEARIAALEAA